MYAPATTTPLYLLFLISFFTFLFHAVPFISAQDDITNIGVIIDVSSRIGKEEKVSIEIAIQTINNASSNKHKLVLHVRDTGGNPLQAYMAAEDLIKKTKVNAIIGMETWQEAVLVAELANRAQVPILSFAAPSITPPLTSVRWPFLVRLTNNDTLQMQCVASIVGSYGWRRVIGIYEDDGYGTTCSGTLTLLSDALKTVGAEIEHSAAFPPLSSLSDPKSFIREELEKLYDKQSRVFIIVGSSLELATQIITQAKDSGLMGRDSVWITADSITNQFNTVNSSVMFSMEGVIGIRTPFSETNPSIQNFSRKFRNLFQSMYPQEDNYEPQIYALRSYDTLSTLAFALEKSSNRTTLLENILSSNFSGLSGQIKFTNGELSRSTTYEVVNVLGKKYIVLKSWSAEYGFSDNVIDKMVQVKNTVGAVMQVLGNRVYWPGGLLSRPPLGWVMPSDANPMVIGIPSKATFEKFVQVNEDGEDPTGFCIDVFNKARERLYYGLPHSFKPIDGKYDELIEMVYNKSVDAVVGDFTILANRSNYVDFTQPYVESALTMVVPVKSKEKVWLFTKPFNSTMWLAISFVFIYTMFVLWFLERRSNPDFTGPWKNQLSTALWFTFSTLFFAHREYLRNNFARVVMVVWLFVVLVVTASYTASLTSMLTVQRLEPTISDIATLRRSNSPIGCDGESFVRKYAEDVLGFHPNNIRNVMNEFDYLDEFKSGKIKAALLELPYERVFISRYGKEYQVTDDAHRFGGFGFAFPKGSPMAKHFSEAFLKLSEDGTLNKLDNFWFKSSSSQASQCKDCDTGTDNQRLGLDNFWGLFLVTVLTSTIMVILYIVRPLRKLRRHSVPQLGTTLHVDTSFWNRIKTLGSYFNTVPVRPSHKDPKSGEARDIAVLVSSNGEFRTYTSEHPQTIPVTEIELSAETLTGKSDTQTKVLRLINSFPGWDRRHGFNNGNPDIPNNTGF